MATATAEHEIGEKGPFGRVWDGEKFVRPAAAVPSEPPAAAAPDLVAIIRESIAAAVAPLQAKIEELESRPVAAPQFQKMDPALGMDFGVAERVAVMKRGNGGEESLPMGSDGHVLDSQVLALVPRRFKPGQAIRVKRDAIRAGMKDEMSWGELMDKLGTVRCPTRGAGNRQCAGRFHVGDACPICGQGPRVLKLGFLNETVGDWVLKVRVPGLTTSYGMAFYSQELEAA